MRVRRPMLVAFPIFAAGLLYSVLPVGMFGSHDIAIRALVAGLTAAVVALPILRTQTRIN